jgi:UPF0271 protein
MHKISSIDLNADLGEGYPYDKDLFPLISSANIACGGHAGDENSIRESLQQCLKYEVKAGAHPSYPDRENFGRRSMQLDRNILQDSIRSQLDIFCNIAAMENIMPHHVKLHGALYNDCFDNMELAEQVLEVVKEYEFLFFYGPSMSTLNKKAEEMGLTSVHEVFVDRAYLPTGKLAPRSTPGSVLHDPTNVTDQLYSILINHKAIAIDGAYLDLMADTICLHGDNDHAVVFANNVHVSLQQWNIAICSPQNQNKK